MATLDDRYERSGATLENPSTSSGAPSSCLDAGMDGRASSANVRASGVPSKSARSARLPPVDVQSVYSLHILDVPYRAVQFWQILLASTRFHVRMCGHLARSTMATNRTLQYQPVPTPDALELDGLQREQAAISAPQLRGDTYSMRGRTSICAHYWTRRCNSTGHWTFQTQSSSGCCR